MPPQSQRARFGCAAAGPASTHCPLFPQGLVCRQDARSYRSTRQHNNSKHYRYILDSLLAVKEDFSSPRRERAQAFSSPRREQTQAQPQVRPQAVRPTGRRVEAPLERLVPKRRFAKTTKIRRNKINNYWLGAHSRRMSLPCSLSRQFYCFRLDLWS